MKRLRRLGIARSSLGNSSTVELRTSDSVNLGSNPSSPATRNYDDHWGFRDFLSADKSAKPERIPHIGRTEVGTVSVRKTAGPLGTFEDPFRGSAKTNYVPGQHNALNF